MSDVDELIHTGGTKIQRDPRPLYVQVQNAILRLVSDQELKPGDTLPSEPELAQLFAVGRSTVREAMMRLEHAGFVQRRRGVGTVLTSLGREPSLGLDTLTALEDLAETQNWSCVTRDLRIEPHLATPSLCKTLEIKQGSYVAKIVRTKVRERQPFAVMESYVPRRTASIELIQDQFDHSITELLRDRYDLRYARAAVSATSAGAAISRALQVRRGAALVTLEELCFSEGEFPIVWNMNYFVPDSVRFGIIRRADQT